MSKTETKLKPCPFCGSKAVYTYGYGYNYVLCTKCPALTRVFDKKEAYDGKSKAINAWNRRVNDDQPV